MPQDKESRSPGNRRTTRTPYCKSFEFKSATYLRSVPDRRTICQTGYGFRDHPLSCSERQLARTKYISRNRDTWIEISVYNSSVLSLTMEYALRAAAFLSQHGGQNCPVQDIAAETQVPLDFLSKVMKDLCRAGLVRSKPGRNGGYALDRPPSDITLFEVIGAVQPIRLLDRCPLNKPCHAHQLCPLHLALRSATEAFASSLRVATLGDLETTGRRDAPTQAVSGSRSIGESVA